MNGKYFKMAARKFKQVIAKVAKMSPGATARDVESILDGDWPNASEHQEWLDKASVAEISDWVDGIYGNMVEPAKHYND